MAAQIVELGANERMTAEQALGLCLRERPREVVILSLDANERLTVRSSAMDRKNALWLIELGRQHVLDPDS